MFTGLMADAWIVGTVVAVVAGVLGFFVVLRGASFVAHAVPLSSFAGAAGAALIGVSTLAGLGVFAPLSALGIGWLGRRGRQDVATALSVAALLGLGSLFLAWGTEYVAATSALLFGSIVGVSAGEAWLTFGLGLAALAAVAVLFRWLLVTSLVPEMAAVRGVRPVAADTAFLVLLALVTTLAVPVVGALIMFPLTVGPPAAARSITAVPARALALSVAMSLVTVWAGLAAAWTWSWPVGFVVGVVAAGWYAFGRVWAWLAARRHLAAEVELAPAA